MGSCNHNRQLLRAWRRWCARFDLAICVPPDRLRRQGRGEHDCCYSFLLLQLPLFAVYRPFVRAGWLLAEILYRWWQSRSTLPAFISAGGDHPRCVVSANAFLVCRATTSPVPLCLHPAHFAVLVSR